jgi:flagellar hook-length control protein FliK
MEEWNMTTQPVSTGNDPLLDLAGRSNTNGKTGGDPAEGQNFERFLLDARSANQAATLHAGTSGGLHPNARSAALTLPEPAAAPEFAGRSEVRDRPRAERPGDDRSRSARRSDEDRPVDDRRSSASDDDRRTSETTDRRDRPQGPDRRDEARAADDSGDSDDPSLSTDEVETDRVDPEAETTGGDDVTDAAELAAAAIAAGGQVVESLVGETEASPDAATADPEGSAAVATIDAAEAGGADTNLDSSVEGSETVDGQETVDATDVDGPAVDDEPTGDVDLDAGPTNRRATADTEEGGDASLDGDSSGDSGSALGSRAGSQSDRAETTTDAPAPTAEVDPAIAAALRQGQTRASTAPTATTTTGTTSSSSITVDAAQAPAVARNRPNTPVASAAAGADAPVVDGEPGEAVWMQVRRALGSLRALENGDQQMTVRLRPAELGSVMVRVAAGEGGTAVSLVTDSAVAALQLGQQRQQLIAELEQNGFERVAVDVGTGGEANPDRTQADGAAGQQTGQGAGNADAGGSAIGAAADEAGADPTLVRPRRGNGSSAGLVDLDL